ncbi:LacI family DNA-binding transcriptional regulator [Vibrio sp. ABG19]|uniref:LacI family DNA-binding transcriptional regulator n=1 Tax=Vibrio sp. ABG19 TaxID=2817385 RepID=UPI00249F5437|nr:LacI family DNA-binding transcriptional regulator [Vibrio sp. ABG19]WGY48718.1 LacI family DNA-binding transcriptional regulator [Vibrio sp. ABG19]
MVTMQDVARRAGVSKSTVSRVLNGKNIVRPEVTQAVFKAIEETGYRPNLLARQLATQKTHFIGFVMTNALYNGPYFSSLVYHAAAFSEQHGHQLVLADGKHSAEDERNAINFLLDMKCAGIVVYPKYLSDRALTEIIQATPTPITVLNRSLEPYSVTTDHYHSAVMMMEHILQQGHRRIAFIRGSNGSVTGEIRYQAYCDQLAQHGLTPDPQLIVQGNWTPESGYHAAQQLIARKTDFSAVLSGNDDMALGAMKALMELGYTIPQDISIAGFDNIKMGKFVTPSLTSVSVPLEQMIQKGILLALGEKESANALSLAGELKIRDSIAAR